MVSGQSIVPQLKPQGFWYEVDGDWRRWCETEEPSWLEGTRLYTLELPTDLRLLRLRTTKALDKFTEDFGVPNLRGMIQWATIAQFYDGIEIAPYIWERSLDGRASDWYYAWDCASGCLWNPRTTKVTEDAAWQEKVR
jgi:hypothetical protein